MSDDLIDIPPDLVAYLVDRERKRTQRAGRAWQAMTRRERRLVREAAVMGYVRGSMAGRVAGASGKEPVIPTDNAIVLEVITACQGMTDLYPVIGHLR